MDTIAQFITKRSWRVILNTIMPGGENWYAARQHCRSDCPGKGCKWNGPDGILCSSRWTEAEATPVNLDVLFHVLNWFDFYSDQDLPSLTKDSKVVRALRAHAHTLILKQEISEGDPRIRSHRYRERNSAAARRLKTSALRNGELRCVVCSREFHKRYGDRAMSMVECHHCIPLASAMHLGKTRVQDLCLVCCNCHALIHSKAKPLTIREAKLLHIRTKNRGRRTRNTVQSRAALRPHLVR